MKKWSLRGPPGARKKYEISCTFSNPFKIDLNPSFGTSSKLEKENWSLGRSIYIDRTVINKARQQSQV